MSESVAIIPTYNESGNINNILENIQDLSIKFDVIVVDDNSPDGTGDIINDLIVKKKFNINITLIERKVKDGLGSAYIEGFQKAISLNYKFIFQIDCDGSHNPKKLVEMKKTLVNDSDIVVGSRYIKGISVLHWPLPRLLLSIFANYYVKFITGMKVNDSTGGFNGYSRDALESILKNKITFQGYAFQIQMKFIGYKLGFKIKEIPIIFKDREIGESKMSINIFYEAFFGILGMKIKSLLFPLKS